ncbi:DivIVA domain-containing protein [Micromonospora sp. CA-263727]|uniref:DivIVA domain-containing protein n=1 Tax=Micromonospora sp. CA-263727 TaxID=3239967 RepID=UPI003D8C21AE
MGQLLLLLVVAVTVAAVVFGVTVLVTGRDPGLGPVEADGRAVPLPGDRPLRESDVGEVRFDTAARGYRMAQVDQALRRAAYDIGYKTELIGVLEAEVAALREGRTADAEALRKAREQSSGPAPAVDASGPAPESEAGRAEEGTPAEDAGTAAAEEVSVAQAESAGPETTDEVRGAGEPVAAGAPEGEPRSSVVRSESA